MIFFPLDSSLSLNLPLNYQLQELVPLVEYYVAQVCCFSTFNGVYVSSQDRNQYW